eukprot:gene5853-6139_t
METDVSALAEMEADEPALAVIPEIEIESETTGSPIPVSSCEAWSMTAAASASGLAPLQATAAAPTTSVPAPPTSVPAANEAPTVLLDNKATGPGRFQIYGAGSEPPPPLSPPESTTSKEGEPRRTSRDMEQHSLPYFPAQTSRFLSEAGIQKDDTPSALAILRLWRRPTPKETKRLT